MGLGGGPGFTPGSLPGSLTRIHWSFIEVGITDSLARVFNPQLHQSPNSLATSFLAQRMKALDRYPHKKKQSTGRPHLTGYFRCKWSMQGGTKAGSPPGRRLMWGISAPVGRATYLSPAASSTHHLHTHEEFQDLGRPGGKWKVGNLTVASMLEGTATTPCTPEAGKALNTTHLREGEVRRRSITLSLACNLVWS